MSAHEPPIAKQPRVRPFDRWLHASYFYGSGIRHFLLRRCRPAGMVLGFVLVLATSLLLGEPDRSSISQLFSLSLGMVFIGIPWAMARRAKVDAQRELPRFGTAGEPLRYTVTIHNRSKSRLTRAWLVETPPDARPGIADFAYLREPGEEERNAFDRKLAYFRWQWLLLGNQLFDGGISAAEVDLKPGQRAKVAVELTPLRRGVIQLKDLRVLLPDPFGLFQRCKSVRAASAALVVLPRRFPLPPIEMPGNAAYKVSGEANTNTIGSSGEFVGLRDYRPGDPLRLIHWKSWARTGRPIVKELEDTFYPRYGLVVDTLSVERTDHRFEEVVSVAASFAAAIDTGESLLDLMFIKDEAHIVTAGRGVARAEKLLEVLAGVTPEREQNFRALADLVIRHREDLTSSLVLLNGWDQARADFLQTLTRAGMVCVPIIVGTGPRPGSAPGHWLESGNIPRDLQRLPSRF